MGAIAFTDDIKHGYKAVERAGRVLGTLAVCINEYVFMGQSATTSTKIFAAIALH